MKIKLSIAYRDAGDGSFSLRLFPTREMALNQLGVTEEQLELGDYYEDGAIEEVELEIDENGNLLNTPSIYIG